jgi:hypothetical protein
MTEQFPSFLRTQESRPKPEGDTLICSLISSFSGYNGDMTTITIDIPEHLKIRYKLWSRVSFDDFTQKIFGDDFVSPDVSFTPISDLSQKEKDTLEMAKTMHSKYSIS